MAGFKSSRLILPIVLVGSVMISACSNPYLERFRAEFGWTEARMTEDGWLKSREIPPDAVYCYKTLAKPNCFKTPKPGQEHRLVSEFENAHKTGN
jgi:hypothetical protein